MRKSDRGARHLVSCWIESEFWGSPNEDWPGTHVSLEVDRRSGLSRVRVYDNRETWCVIPCQHRSKWTMTNVEVWIEMGKFVSRAAKARDASQGASHEATVAFQAEFPATWEFLTLEEHDDGAKRERGLVLLLWENGVFKACMQDRDQQRSLWVSGRSPLLALCALEDALSDPTADWRDMGGQKAKKK